MKKRLLCAALLLALTACAPSPSPTPTSAPADGSVPVRTDWSKLSDRETPVGSRWYEGYVDELRPGADYGMLIPYVGRRLSNEWPAEDGFLYGLMTREGAVVTDPVFPEIVRPGYWLGEDWCTHPLLVLTRRGEEGREIAVAAADGSWITGFDYRGVRPCRDGLVLWGGAGFTLMDPDGRILGTYSREDMGITEQEYEMACSDLIYGFGIGGQWQGDAVALGWTGANGDFLKVFHPSTGETEAIFSSTWDRNWQESYAPRWQVEETGNGAFLLGGGERYPIPAAWTGSWLEPHGPILLFDNHQGAGDVRTGEVLLPSREMRTVGWSADKLLGDDARGMLFCYDRSGEKTRCAWYWPDGTEITLLRNWADGTWAHRSRRCALVGGLVERLDLNMAEYSDPVTGVCVFRTALGYEAD